MGVGIPSFSKVPKPMYGIELEEAKGICDGTFKKVQYFSCKMKFGVYVEQNKVSKGKNIGKKVKSDLDDEKSSVVVAKKKKKKKVKKKKEIEPEPESEPESEPEPEPEPELEVEEEDGNGNGDENVESGADDE